MITLQFIYIFTLILLPCFQPPCRYNVTRQYRCNCPVTVAETHFSNNLAESTWGLRCVDQWLGSPHGLAGHRFKPQDLLNGSPMFHSVRGDFLLRRGVLLARLQILCHSTLYHLVIHHWGGAKACVPTFGHRAQIVIMRFQKNLRATAV